MSDKRLAITVNQNAELQALVQKCIDVLTYGHTDIEGALRLLTEEYNEITARYAKTLAALDYEEPSAN